MIEYTEVSLMYSIRLGHGKWQPQRITGEMQRDGFKKRAQRPFQHRTLLVEVAQTWQRLIEYAANIKSAQVNFVSEPDRGD